ncbi:hypothetical protein GHT06_020308 [Daphnia sinensis]|uniref:Uncharacterized protein n=1 Tax=Daphnia sinensis TaxID=1820382 RepID=A0AAD5PS80_9CRUS|nr:hypothetical protein GHT06_020308 [Daphnia sinensis]
MKLLTAIEYIKLQQERVIQLEANLVDVKLAFADAMTDQFQAPVLVASFAAGAAPADQISLAEMEQLLESSAGGPVPSSVRQKDNNIYVRLNDPADVERAKSIQESKEGPNHKSIFNSVSRTSKFYPAVALFVDLSYLPNLKDEIMSVSQLYAKPDSSRGHVKILFNCKATRDSVLLGGEIYFFNTSVRGYGHVKTSCRAKKPNCSKCAGTHLTRDCNSQERKCSGDRFCQVQMKAVARYRARIERD